MMLAGLDFYLGPCGLEGPAMQMGSLFHGWLMDRIDPRYAELLHQPGPKPFSQYVERRGGETVWHLATLNQESYHYILEPLLEHQPEAIHLTAKEVTFPVLQAQARTAYASYKDLADLYYLERPPVRRLVMTAISPVAFRSDGEYQIFPREFHILQSLVTRWNIFADAVSLEGDETLEAMVEATRITRYRLESRSFPLERTRIPGFIGAWEMTCRGPELLGRLVAMLAHYAGYAGIGVKTALGMGGIRIEQSFPVKHARPNSAPRHERGEM